MNKCTTNHYMVFLIHAHVSSYDPESAITIPFNIHNIFNEKSHDHWHLYNVWYIQKRLYSRRRSLWVGVNAKTLPFLFGSDILGCEDWLSEFWESRRSHLEGIRPVDVAFGADLTLLGAPLVTTFLGGGDNIVSSGNPSWRIASLMWSFIL